MSATSNFETALVELANDAIDEAISEYKWDDKINEAVNEYDFEKAIENALDDYDLDRQIEKAVESQMDNLDLDSTAETAVNEAVERANLKGTVHDEVKELLLSFVNNPTAFVQFLDLVNPPTFSERVKRTRQTWSHAFDSWLLRRWTGIKENWQKAEAWTKRRFV